MGFDKYLNAVVSYSKPLDWLTCHIVTYSDRERCDIISKSDQVCIVFYLNRTGYHIIREWYIYYCFNKICHAYLMDLLTVFFFYLSIKFINKITTIYLFSTSCLCCISVFDIYWTFSGWIRHYHDTISLNGLETDRGGTKL